MDEFQKELYMKTIAQAMGGQTQDHFAASAGLTKGNFSRICGGQLARPDTLKKIADASSTVSYVDLLIAAGYLDKEIFDLRDKTQPDLTDKALNIPIIPGKEGAAAPLQTFKFFSQNMQAAGYIFFIAEDDALAPRICRGDMVLLRKTQDFKDGDIVLFTVDHKERKLRYLRKNKKNYDYYSGDMLRYPLTGVAATAINIEGVAETVLVSLKNE